MVLNQIQKSLLSKYLMVELHKPQNNQMHFATFDETGEYVTLKFNNNRFISAQNAISKQDIKTIGFKIMTRTQNDEKGYLHDKGFQINEHCNCLSRTDQEISHSKCDTVHDCIIPKKMITFAFPLENVGFAHTREKLYTLDDEDDN